MRIPSFSELLILYLSQNFFDFTLGLEEVLEFCSSNGFKFVTFVGHLNINHNKFVKKASKFGIRIRFLHENANFDYVRDMDMLVSFIYHLKS